MMDQSNKKKVLVVDDELGVRRLVRQILSQNYAVLEAQDGEEAVNIARNQDPDLILMDMMMPKMDGLTACRAIKQDQATKGIVVVMLTAIGYDLNRKLAENVAGASAYMTKPFDSQELLSTVGRLLSSKNQASDSAGTEALNNVEELKK
jgi:two-component system, OmpR family, alkaline phosphatase synthesis response regulator PhoP